MGQVYDPQLHSSDKPNLAAQTSSSSPGTGRSHTAQLVPPASYRTYQPGDVIFHEGASCKGMYYIGAGTVAIRKRDSERKSIIVRLVHADQPLGYRTFFSGGRYSGTAEALSQASVGFIERERLERALAEDPEIASTYLKRLAEDLRGAEEDRLSAFAMSVRSRLVRLLLRWKDRFASVADNGTLAIELPLARRDIAAMLGARPETIARAIRALEEDNVAHFSRRSVLVLDLDLLLDELDPLE